MTPFFSVVIPAYNAERWISDTLQSVQLQTFQDFEIIVVDDGSKDATYDVVQNFLTDVRITIVRQSNQGEGKTRNACMQRAKGAYLA